MRGDRAAGEAVLVERPDDLRQELVDRRQTIQGRLAVRRAKGARAWNSRCMARRRRPLRPAGWRSSFSYGAAASRPFRFT